MLCTEMHRLHHVFILSAIAHIRSDIYIFSLPKIISESLSFTPLSPVSGPAISVFPDYGKIFFSTA